MANGVYIEYGSETRTFTALVGKALSDAIGDIRGFLSVPSDINPTVNGVTEAGNYVFKEGDRVVFTKATGTKGINY